MRCVFIPGFVFRLCVLEVKKLAGIWRWMLFLISSGTCRICCEVLGQNLIRALLSVTRTSHNNTLLCIVWTVHQLTVHTDRHETKDAVPAKVEGFLSSQMTGATRTSAPRFSILGIVCKSTKFVKATVQITRFLRKLVIIKMDIGIISSLYPPCDSPRYQWIRHSLVFMAGTRRKIGPYH